MKVIGNVLYVEKNTFSEVDYISNTNIDKEWSFMKKIKDIIMIVFSYGIVIYVFCW